MIPRILHAVWFGSPLPDWAARHLDAFREHNPDWQVKLYEQWPPRRMPANLSRRGADCDQLCQLADLVYVWALANEGGVVLDLDHIVRRSFEPLRKYTAFTTRHSDGDARCTNGSMGAEAGGPFVRAMEFCVKIDPPKRRQNIDRCFYGPDLITRLYDQAEDMTILPWAWFYPWQVSEKQTAERWAQASPAGRAQILSSIADRFAELPGGPYSVHLWGVAGSSHAKVPSEFNTN